MRPYFLGGLAEAHRAAGRLNEGLASIAEALEHAERGPDRFFDAELHRLKGELLLALRIECAIDAENLFHRALDIARLQEAKSFELRAAMSLARLWQRKGKSANAARFSLPSTAGSPKGSTRAT